MMAKIDVRSIVTDHMRTLVKTDERVDIGDYVLFFVFPIAAALALVLLNRRLTEQTENLLLAAFSIFAGLLLNLLVLVHGLIRRYRSEDKDKDARRLLREIYANMSYGVLVCIVGILLLVVAGVGRYLPVAVHRFRARFLRLGPLPSHAADDPETSARTSKQRVSLPGPVVVTWAGHWLLVA